MKTLSVYLLDSARATDRAFDYLCPKELEADVGSIVTVPFGKGNRPMNAVVCSVHDGTSPDLKSILSLSDTASLTAELLDLAFFMRDRTLCTLGDAVHAMIPSEALSRFVARYYPTDKLEKGLIPAWVNEEGRTLVGLVLAYPGADESELRRRLGSDVKPLLAELVRRRVIIRDSVERVSSNVKYDVFFSLAVSPDQVQAMLDSSGKDAIRGRLQRKIVEMLLGGKKSEEELKSVGINTPRTTGAVLVKRGIIQYERHEHYRNPYLAAETEAKNSKKAAKAVEYSDEQRRAIDSIAEVAAKGAGAVLLHGVTGSGKTLVIKAIIDRTLESGRGAIVLVPEIALTPQTVAVYCSYFGDRVAVMHSSLSAGERFDAWRRVRDGLCDVVIGTRSAVFAPVRNLGLIVIDEEQEHTYKSDTSPKYLAHDIARKRCADCGALMLLASATPSLASYYKAKAGIYKLVELTKRYNNAALPEVSVVDMRREITRGNATVYSAELLERLERMKARGGQAILFLNRRGYNSVVTCRRCGENLKCPNCSVSLTYHSTALVDEHARGEYLASRRQSGMLMCHYCGYRCAVPARCPECQDGNLLFMGTGTQRAAAELERAIPGISVLRMDADNTRKKFSHEAILDAFRRGEADVLLGTQMVTKGHDFPKVELVGVLNADSSLYLDDFRASERTFAMLTQVIGRAGRAGGEGIAVVQTTNPSSEVICLASEQNYPEFYKREIALRRALQFPPFCDIAMVCITSKDDVVLSRTALALTAALRSKLEGGYSDVKAVVYGPIEAPVYRVQNEYRMRIIVKCRLAPRSRALFSELIGEFRQARRYTVTVDFNPSGI